MHASKAGKDAIMALSATLAAEENAATDLWTWLPSYQTSRAVLRP